uniref:Auxin response factor n=1 Tax=Salvia miltiorrhiza TaxID=226208 RepID=A0A191T8S7_SALMI|nr:auxin response factor ARF10 [Salvia miltiorrhiza]
MKLSTSEMGQQAHEGEKKCLNSELWHACAGPLVSLPTVGSRVVYFPQGHSEQVAATTNKEVDAHIPNYPSLSPQLICQLHNVTMHADVETDEVYAQMTLQPLTPIETDLNVLLDAARTKRCISSGGAGMPNRQPTNYFCKTLTASDTVPWRLLVPRRAAEESFPTLGILSCLIILDTNYFCSYSHFPLVPQDFSQTPPAQELMARDLHDVEWKFRHIFRGQPKRHLLTTGWSVFVSAKRLVAGDSVLFIWNEKNQLLLGIRRATRPQTVMPSSVLSSDSMHIGLLAAAAHAAATNSCFTVFYNPRWASPSEFVISLSKYAKAVYHTRVSVGMRFRMLFETEESSVRRYMGTITSIGDLDPVRWANSHWRSVKVGWDESTAGERQPRVSLWEIEPLTTFPMYPSLLPLRLKRPWYPGASSFQGTSPTSSSNCTSISDAGSEAINGMPWLRGEVGEAGFNSINFQSVGMLPWMQQRFDPTALRNDLNQQYQAIMAAGLQNQFQQPVDYLQQSGSHNPQTQQQHTIQPSVPSLTLPLQTQMLSDNMQRPTPHQVSEENHTYQEAYLARHPSDIPSPWFTKSEFSNSASVTHPCVQNMLGSLCPEGSSGNLVNSSRAGQATLDEQSPQHSWVAKYSGKDASMEQENCTLDVQDHQSLFGASVDSGLLLPTTVSRVSTSSVQADMFPMPLGSSGFQSPLYSYVQDSSDLLHNTGQVDQPTPDRIFVKVYKMGSVGRSVDIGRFSSYEELRQELGQMFRVEGLLEDPQRSGWQLVFVDRENDILLLGDDPWEAFVNNVWYIKILSPEDVVKLGKQEGDTGSVERTNNADVHNLPSLHY